MARNHAMVIKAGWASLPCVWGNGEWNNIKSSEVTGVNGITGHVQKQHNIPKEAVIAINF